MEDIDKLLDEYDMHIEHSCAEDREPIDFEIRDDKDNLCATVWGSEPWDDVQIDCEHPCIEYDDDETVGECPICGATCTWHYAISADDGYITKDRVADEWTNPDVIGGVVGKYLEELQGKW